MEDGTTLEFRALGTTLVTELPIVGQNFEKKMEPFCPVPRP